MLEWLAASTGLELGKFVLEQVLDLGKPVLEGYVQDFFKGCLNSGVARLKATTLKTPMAEAIGCFMQQFIEELQFHDVPDTSIDHFYRSALKDFVRDRSIGQILGKAFETGCKHIDHVQLEQIWAEHYQDSGWNFPQEFDWQGIAKAYVKGVKGIVKANPELRDILNSDLLEDIAHNTAQLSPGFDVETYRQSLQASYGYLKLYTLDSTDRVDAIKLWNIFIEQTVREALPPIRYDLPLDLKRQLQDEGQLEHDLSPEALELYRRDYFQQPARKVLTAVADSHRAVILGDPGSGKSSLLQYLALEWVEGNAETLPLLIELREFALNPSANFLEFLHQGRGVDWQFDQQQLHQHLLDNPTLVMFDGLDEVFDRATQSTVIDDIIRFSQQYPNARVLVTSRIIGYNPERLQHSGFRHFTIQSLDTDEMHEFIDRWYDLSLGSDPDKVRLKQRLKDAIDNSKAIQNLADNPLLLTMMAILNRRQELPRIRTDLYDRASEVLLYQWDIEHKSLNLPLDTIQLREKREMLRLIAYEMQAGEDGLKGNLISADRLTRILTDYLRDQGFSEPREKANRLIQQLRERNFILCYRGADTYGFMHRTFLEYFCAVEIVHRFEKQRTLTFEQLRDEVFGNHWQDETWHEVLRLICGAIDVKFAGQLVKFLLEQEIDATHFLDQEWLSYTGEKRISPGGKINLLLGADCFSEIISFSIDSQVKNSLIQQLKTEVENPKIRLTRQTASEIIDRIAMYFNDANTATWLKSQVQNNKISVVQKAAVIAVAKYFRDVETYLWLKEVFQQGIDWGTRLGAIEAIAQHYLDEPDSWILLKQAAQDYDWGVRCAAIDAMIEHSPNKLGVFTFLYEIIQNDPFKRNLSWEDNPRKVALEGLIEHYCTHPKTIELLRDRAINDPDEQLREWAQEQLQQMENQGKGESSQWT
ncbi:MAG: NACHT domain-containing protein [Elainellaceae cyanobacterium]